MIRNYARELSVAAALGLLLLLLSLLSPKFFEGANLRAVIVSDAPVIVAALGMTIVILTRQIDISIGSQLSICCVATLPARSRMSRSSSTSV